MKNAALVSLLVGAAATASTPCQVTNAINEARNANLSGAIDATMPAESALHGDLWAQHSAMACFAPGTDLRYQSAFMDWVYTESGIDPQNRFFIGTSWTSQGDAVEITYSFPPDGISVSGGTSSSNEVNSRFASWFGSTAAGKAKVREVFDRWEQLAGITYTEVTDDGAFWGAAGPLSGSFGRGDIRIACINIDGISNTLAFNFFPFNGDMVLDRSENFGSSFNNFRFFRNVVSHENGHGMGLFHSCPQNGTKLMEPAANTNFDGPQVDDILGMQRQHGDRFEKFGGNDTLANAITLPSISPTLLLTDLSIDDNQDTADWFRFTTDGANAVLDVFLSIGPGNMIYANGQQNPNGSCQAGTTTNQTDNQDLAIQVIAPDGVTVLATADSVGPGGGESITNLNLAAIGTYYVRVYPETANNDIQRYQLRLDLSDEVNCPGDITGDNAVDFSDLNLLLAFFGQVGAGLQADVDGDGDVDFSDLNIVLSNFGTFCN